MKTEATLRIIMAQGQTRSTALCVQASRAALNSASQITLVISYIIWIILSYLY